MIRSLYIINEYGICLFKLDLVPSDQVNSKGDLGDLVELNSEIHLFAGFISSINAFAKMSTGQNLDTIEIDSDEIMFFKEKNIIFVLRYEKNPYNPAQKEGYYPLLEQIQKKFLDAFPDVIREVTVTVQEFVNFEPTVKELISSWLRQQLKSNLLGNAIAKAKGTTPENIGVVEIPENILGGIEN